MHRLGSVRAYDADDVCVYELGDVCDGTDVERLLDRALADRRTDYVNIHTATGLFSVTGRTGLKGTAVGIQNTRQSRVGRKSGASWSCPSR